MKKKKIILPIIISTILMSMPTQIYGWLQYSTYEACNIVNVFISWIMKAVAFIIAISYITGMIQYLKHSEQEKNLKVKNVLTWLMVVIVDVIFFSTAAVWVTEIGMEKYWSNGERFQFNEIDGYITYGIRIIALVLIIAYIITAITYFIKSKQEKIKKIENVVRWQVITTALVAGLLILATRW